MHTLELRFPPVLSKFPLIFFISLGIALLSAATFLSSPAAAQDGTDGEPFITIWKTDIGFSSDDFITIPGEGENYSIEWTEVEEVDGDWVVVDNPNTGSETGSGEHRVTFQEPGAYRVEISGNFTRIVFGQGGGSGKILDVEQWGDIEWSTMEEAFVGTSNLNISASDAPDLSRVTSMQAMFWDSEMNADISHWDVSNVTDMSRIFEDAVFFNQNLNSWDVSGVTTMADMFQDAEDFNGDISGWNTGSVTDMSSMFHSAGNFNQGLSSWDVSSVTSMAEMFDGADAFNADLSGWNVSNVSDMNSMFSDARSFNSDLSSWDVSGVTTMAFMFSDASTFNGNISGWNPENVSTMESMFSGADSFNQDLGNWNVSSVTVMADMFSGASSFNGDLSGWNVSNVTDMSEMFSFAVNFNQGLSSWDVSSVTTMASMFSDAESFNGDLSGWNPQNVTDMSSMFSGAVNFNQALSSWDVSSVTTMASMFLGTESFNRDLSEWNPQNVSDMRSMFTGALNFNQDLSSWDVSSVETMAGMFQDAESFNGDLNGWNPQNVTDMTSMFSGALNFNQDLSNWNVSSVTTMVNMFSDAEVFNGDISTWDVSNVTNMRSMFRATSFMKSAFNQTLSSWDVSGVENMANMFSSAESFNGDLSGWNPENVTTMTGMFENATSFNRDISGWNPQNVTNMEFMFRNATSFNQDLGSWDVSSVETMRRMFENAETFNGGLNGWNPMSVTDMTEMFKNAFSFNRDLGSWDVSSVTTMEGMFSSAELFNGDLSGWNPQNVRNMSNMFIGAVNFNRDISSWDVSNVRNMNNMFLGADSFNGEIGGWDVSSVTNMNGMLRAESFNQDIGNWDVSSVERMERMFSGARSFNQDIGGWSVSNVFTMEDMFAGAENFNQSLGSWDVSNVGQMDGILNETDLSAINYDGTLIGWSERSLQSNVTLGARGLNYCGATEERQTIIDQYGWDIIDEGKDCSVSGDLAINPQRAGNLGPTTITVLGSDLTGDYSAKLTQDGQADIVGQTLLVADNGTELEVRFDLTDQSTGTWDFVLTGPGEISQTLEGAFTIVEGEEPEVWAEIQGANNILGGQSTTVNINFGNRSNTDIHDVMLFVRVPQEANISVARNQMLGTAVENWVDPGALDSDVREGLEELNPYFNMEGEGHTLLPLWYYRLPARTTNTLSIQITPSDPSSPRPLADSIEVEIAALSIENDFARTGDFNESKPLLLSGMITEFLETAANLNQKTAGMRSASFSNNPPTNIASLNEGSSCNNVKPELNVSAEDIRNQIDEDRSIIVETGRNLVNPTNVAQGLVIGIGTAAICGVTFGTPCLAATGIGLLNEANTLYQAYEAADEELSDEEKEQVEENFMAECREQKPAPPYRPSVRPSNGPNGGGRSFGHPHFMSFDRQDFDFQAVGELILTRSTIDDLELQVRLERINSNFQDFTIITAAAMSVAGDEVVIEEDRGSFGNLPTLKINGTSMDLPDVGAEPMMLPGGGSIKRSGRTLIVEWPDGNNRVDVRQSATEMGILAEPMFSTDYAGKVDGLLGNMDGNTENDFTTRGGTVLVPPLSFDELYREFGDSWRITQEESLFGTETFENLNIPSQQVTTADMDPNAVSEAKSVCQDFGIKDPILLDNCIFDIAQTGDERFAIDTRELITPVANEQVKDYLSDTDTKIQISLDAAPAGGEEFTFSGSGELGDFVLSNNGNSSTVTHTDAFPYLPAGSYDITQQLPNEDDWELSDISCTAAQGITTDLGNGSVTIDLAEGDVVRCTFKTIGRPLPVTLGEPTDEQVVAADSVLFTWQEGDPQIDQYQFELATDETFTSIQLDSVLTDTSIVLGDLADQNTYWWRVRAQNDVGFGEYSDPQTFSFMPTSVDPSAGVPVRYELSQNYPNPFNPSTVIEYALPETGYVELLVYNILGREVATLVNGQKQAGYHQVTFDASNLASGLYIYHLRAEGFEQSHQMTLIK